MYIAVVVGRSQNYVAILIRTLKIYTVQNESITLLRFLFSSFLNKNDAPFLLSIHLCLISDVTKSHRKSLRKKNNNQNTIPCHTMYCIFDKTNQHKYSHAHTHTLEEARTRIHYHHHTHPHEHEHEKRRKKNFKKINQKNLHCPNHRLFEYAHMQWIFVFIHRRTCIE